MCVKVRESADNWGVMRCLWGSDALESLVWGGDIGDRGTLAAILAAGVPNFSPFGIPVVYTG